ncbi:hypothetical protein C8J57DRAFT_1652470 [Mycena rebaudengoi]|nr:hypothetical protein C8J57DRAFT_1652470 [Mycena rebaudengoi]
MLILTGTFGLLLLARSSTCLPARRQNANQMAVTIQDAMASIYNMYMTEQNVKVKSFYPLFAGETEIDFAGVGSSEDDFSVNSAIFDAADRLPHMDNYNSTGQLAFSVHYGHFIQALINTTQDQTPEQAAQLADLSTNKTVACITNFTRVTNDAYKLYTDAGGTAKTTDSVFIQFATQLDGEYTLAKEKCLEAQNAFDKANQNINGDDAGIIGQAITTMRPILNAEQTSYPGLNMPTSGIANASGAVGMQFTGTYVPFYSMPSLNSTLALWQSNTDDTKTAIAWNSTHDTQVSVSGSQSSGASVHWLWNSASASQSSNYSFVMTQTQSTLISFGGIELINVERGAWFDNFRAASAVGNPEATDPLAKPHHDVFVDNFGTPENPGPASIYNDKALVVYKPRATFKYASQEDYNAAKEAQAQASVSGGLWGVSANAQDQSKAAEFNDQDFEIVFSPDNKNAYIVGFVMHSYWDDVTNPGTSTNKTRRSV